MKMVICTNALGESVEAAIDTLEFRPSVYGIIIKDGQVLLTRQWDGFDFPGGGVDMHETLEEALVREVKEETGITVQKGDMLYMHQDFFVHPGTKKCYNALLFFYKCEYVSGSVDDFVMGDHEHDYQGKPLWMPLDELNESLKMYTPVDSPALARLAAMI